MAPAAVNTAQSLQTYMFDTLPGNSLVGVSFSFPVCGGMWKDTTPSGNSPYAKLLPDSGCFPSGL